MQPYVIKQGDYLALLAYKYDFDADAVWNDPSNDELRQLRPNPNILWPTDVLHIPNQAKTTPDSDAHNIATGQTNTFASDAPKVTVNVRFTDPRFASQSCTVRELDSISGLTTDANGLVSFAAPVTLDVATLSFDSLGIECACKIGYLDPPNTLSGVFQRLQNLGYIPSEAQFNATDLEPVRSGLRALKWATGGADALAAPPSADSPATTDDNAPSAQDVGDAAADTSAPPSSQSDPSAASQPPLTPTWRADGLSEDGTLDDATARLLLDTHGC